jgi:hypothetical protein
VLGELLVRFRIVDADRVVRDVELADGIAALTERLAFGRSPAGERFREPGEDDGTLALVIGELMGAAIRARQIERRCQIARLQLGSRGLPKPGKTRHYRQRDTCRGP